jgi:hypothetical protein
MDSKQLYAALEQAGWSFGSSIEDTGVSWYAYRRLIGGKDCACNDKPPTLTIKPWDQEFSGHRFQSAEFSVRGQLSDGKWVEFQVYSIKYDDVLSQADKCTKILCTAWNAAVELGA